MGSAIRIYYPRPYKGAYVFVEDDKVTHASTDLAFTVGWPRTKLAERAAAVGFRMSTVLRMTAPHPAWLDSNLKTKDTK